MEFFDKPQASIQCMDIVLHEVFNNQHTLQLRNSFFDRPSRSISLDAGYELWIGLFQSAVLGWRPYLNVDVIHKAFPCGQSIIDYIRSCDSRFDPTVKMQRFFTETMEQSLKGFSISYESPFTKKKHPRRFNAFVQPAGEQKFTECNGRTMTVETYFKEQGYVLKYPNLPCLWLGDTAQKVYIPAEFCVIPPGQVFTEEIMSRL